MSGFDVSSQEETLDYLLTHSQKSLSAVQVTENAICAIEEQLDEGSVILRIPTYVGVEDDSFEFDRWVKVSKIKAIYLVTALKKKLSKLCKKQSYTHDPLWEIATPF